jgi:PKD repeat protein
MKKLLTLLFLSFLFVAHAQNPADNQAKYVTGEVFVMLNPSSNKDISYDPASQDLKTDIPTSVLKKYGITKIRKPFTMLKDAALQNTYVVYFQQNSETEKLLRTLKKLDFVNLVERVPQYEFFFTPNDFAGLWHLPKIQAENAWDINAGSSSVLLAVVDDAVKLTHQDLSAKIWTNPGEVASNGIDDDGNGYIDDVNGWDAADNDNNPAPPASASDFYFSHGTHVAGIAAGATNNGVGIASIGYGVTIMPVKIADNTFSSLTGAFDGVAYAIASNADIISMSWGGGAYSAVYQTIFNNAYTQGIVCVAAAGNNNSSLPMYPASYNHVISVAASDQSDLKASFSNYGTTIDVTAPGVDIISPVATSNTSYIDYDGTSMACPMVSGIIGLMLSHVPTLTPDEVESCLESSCDDFYALNPGYIGQLGAGRVNAWEALKCLKLINADFTSNFTVACPNQAIQFTDLSTGVNPVVTWAWQFPGGVPATSSLQNPIVSYPSTGVYAVTLTVSNADGTDVITKTTYVTIAAPTASISGTHTIFAGYTVNIPISFTGNAPWSFTYFDGTTSTNVTGVTSNPYYLSVAPLDTTTYTITAVSDSFCAGTSSGSAQVNVINGTSSIACYFTKMYGDMNNNSISNYYYDAIEGEFGLCGQSTAGKPLFMRLAADGSILAQQEYSGVISYYSSITRAPNGDWLMLGLVSGANDIHITRVDEDGNVLWSKKYDNGTERAPYLTKSLVADEYFVTFMGDLSGTSDDLAIFKINGSGNLIWSRQYNFTDDQFYYCTPNSSGGIVTTGGLHNGAWGWASGMVDMDADGIVTKSKDVRNTAGSEVRCETYYILNTTDGGYATLGMYTTINPIGVPIDLSLKKFDLNMNLEWEKTIEVDYTYSSVGGARGLAQDNSGHLYVSLSQPTSTTAQYAKILKFDPSGNYLWSKKFSNVPYLRISNTNSFPDDNMILFGSYDGGAFGGTDVFFARTDTSLNSCLVEPDASTLYTSPFDVLALDLTQANLPYLPTTNTISATNLNWLDTNLCDPCFVCTIEADFAHSFGCVGDSVHFTNHSTDANATINNYEWHFGDGSILIGPSDPSHIYAAAGTYTVTLIISNDAVPICYDTLEKQITIYDELTLELLPTDTTVCPYQDVPLWAQGHCGTEPYSYVWSPAAGLSDPLIQNPVASIGNSTVYYVTVYDAAGDSAVGQVSIIIDSTCCQPSALISGPSEGCTGNPIQFINNSISNDVFPDYAWDFGPDATPSSYLGETPPPVYFDVAGNHTISLILVDSCGTDTAWFTFYLGDKPAVDAGRDTALCATDTLGLGNNTIGAGLIYSWTPLTGLLEPSMPNPIAIANGSITYIVEVTDNFTGCKNRDTVEILMLPQDVDFIEDTLICPNDSVVFAAPFPILVDYEWNTGETSSEISVVDSGLYSVTVTYGTCIYSDQAVVSYKAVAELVLDPDTSICSQDTLYLSASVPGGSQYIWNDGTNKSSIIITEAGDYRVVLFNGCEYISSAIRVEEVDCACEFTIFAPTSRDGAVGSSLGS